MDKFFLFYSNATIPSEPFKAILSSVYKRQLLIVFEKKNKGYLVAESSFFDQLNILLPLLIADLGLVLTFVAAHKINEFTEYALQVAHQRRPQKCWHLADVVIEDLMVGSQYLKKLLIDQFDDVSRELKLTAQAFIESGLNASQASNKLYVHRNTFNYRLAKFIDATNLDIRDYHFSLLFHLYLIIAGN